MLAVARQQLRSKAAPGLAAVLQARELSGSASRCDDRDRREQETIDFGEPGRSAPGALPPPPPLPPPLLPPLLRLLLALQTCDLSCPSAPQASSTCLGMRSRRWWARCLAAWQAAMTS